MFSIVNTIIGNVIEVRNRTLFSTNKCCGVASDKPLQEWTHKVYLDLNQWNTGAGDRYYTLCVHSCKGLSLATPQHITLHGESY